MTVNITRYITNMPQFQQVLIAFLLVFSAGYVVSDSSTAPEETFDVFSYKAQEISGLMDSAFENPSEDNLRTINNKLAIIEWRWLNQNEGGNKELFVEYLDACQLVIDGMQDGKTADTSEMNMKYDKLVNN